MELIDQLFEALVNLKGAARALSWVRLCTSAMACFLFAANSPHTQWLSWPMVQQRLRHGKGGGRLP